MTTDTMHLRDDELLRLTDGEADTTERARWDAHLAACARCSEEAAQLRADAVTFRSVLTAAAYEVDLPPRPSYATIAVRRNVPAGGRPGATAWRAAPAWLRAAAVVLLVAAPVAAFPALRDWLVGSDRNSDVPAETVTPTLQNAPAPVSGPVRFVPASDTFVVQFDAAQQEGVLRIAAVTGNEGVLTIEQAQGELPVYSETMLRIQNTAQSAATYALQLPLSVRTLTVRVGDRTLQVIGAAGIRAGAVVRLQP